MWDILCERSTWVEVRRMGGGYCEYIERSRLRQSIFAKSETQLIVFTYCLAF
jgi:hypothetical protein